MRKSKAFTVMELMVAVVILAIIVSLSSVGYAKYREKAAMLVDETNEKTLLAAAKLYAYDTNAMPGSLSQLRTRDLERAYALVTEGKRPYTLFAFCQEQLGLLNIAEAVVVPGPLDRYLGGNSDGTTTDAQAKQIRKIMTCPVDPNPPSYGITTGASGAAGKPLSWLLNPANAGAIVITETALRHQGGTIGVKISASGVVSRDTTLLANIVHN